jgi:hypothetical protein
MSDKEKLQAFFDKAVSAMVKQGCSSAGQYEYLYRGIKNDKPVACAIGLMLTDEQIQKYKVVEGSQPNSFSPELVQELIPDVSTIHAKTFMTSLQKCHDLVAYLPDFVSAFINKSNELAKLYDLTPYTPTKPTI